MRLCEHLHVWRQGCCSLNFFPGKARWSCLSSRSGTARHHDQDCHRATRVVHGWHLFGRSTVQKSQRMQGRWRVLHVCIVVYHSYLYLTLYLTLPWRHMSREKPDARTISRCLCDHATTCIVCGAATTAAPRREVRISDCAMLGHSSGKGIHCGFPLPCLM